MIEAMSTETFIRKLFTVEEFQQILDAGILPPDTSYELIRGEFIQMPNPTPPHGGRVRKLNRLFSSALGDSAIVMVQDAMAILTLIPMSKPRPDVAILKPLPELFGPFEPEPEDVLLLVEVSDTSLKYDTETKASLYAEAGIPEYWILNIPNETLEVRTDPIDGKYRSLEVFRPGQTVSPRLLPGFTFAVDDILK
jgi:Uma2 family endonuclease